LNDCTLVT